MVNTLRKWPEIVIWKRLVITPKNWPEIGIIGNKSEKLPRNNDFVKTCNNSEKLPEIMMAARKTMHEPSKQWRPIITC